MDKGDTPAREVSQTVGLDVGGIESLFGDAVAIEDDAISILRFLEWTPERERANAAFDALGALIRSKLVVYDPQSTGYVKMPLEFATSPDKMAYRLFDSNTITTHLYELAQKQQTDNG